MNYTGANQVNQVDTNVVVDECNIKYFECASKNQSSHWYFNFVGTRLVRDLGRIVRVVANGVGRASLEIRETVDNEYH